MLLSIKTLSKFSKSKNMSPTISNKSTLKQTLQQKKIQKLQQKLICDQLGIDIEQISNYNLFFDQIKSIKLPDNWKAKLVNQNQLIYYNTLTQQISYTHPNNNLFKIFFYQQTYNDRNAATFKDKSRKLLPFIQQKLMKQFIGLPSRRKQVQKINLRKDSSGKMVTNKLSRISPDTKKLLSTRSYLLKGVVQKILTKKEIWGVGKRAKKYSEILQKKQQEQQQIIEEDIQLIQKIFSQAAEFYQVQYGQLEHISRQISQSVLYKVLTPEIVIYCLNILNIQKQSIEHYWLGKVMNCLELPPLWRRIKGKSCDQFYYQPLQLIFETHPSIIYMSNQLNSFKIRYQKLQNIQKNYYLGFRQMEFIDFLQRSYLVDMYSLMVKQSQINLNLNINIDQQNIVLNSENRKNNKYLQTIKKIQVQNDWMMIQGIKVAEIIPQNLVMIDIVQKFWKSIDFRQEIWQPSVSPYGDVLWNHNISGRCMKQCPFQNRLKRYVDLYRDEVIPMEDNYLKKNFNVFNELDEYEVGYIQKNFKQKLKFLHFYIYNSENKKNPQYQIPKNFNIQTYFSVVFNCPFDFQEQILKNLQISNQQIPLWIQKVQAKRYKQNLQAILQQFHDQQSINILFELVKQLYIKSTQMKQIQNLQTVKASFPQNLTMSKDQLIRLIDFAFDIQQREQRVKKMRKKFEQYNENISIEQILGSQQSNSQIESHEQQKYEIEQVSERLQGELMDESQQQSETIMQQKQQKKQESIEQEKQQIIKEVQKQQRKQQIQAKLDLLQCNQEELDSKLKRLKSIKIKSEKYKKNKKFNSKIIQNVNKIDDTNYRINSKKNLILTNLKKHQIPNKINLIHNHNKIKKNILLKSEIPPSQISQNHHIFNSHHSNYTNSSIHNIIQNSKIKNNHKIIEPPKQIHIQSKIQPIQKKSYQQSQLKSQQSFSNTYLKIIKQSIKDDPHLQHINQFITTSDFNQTFGRTISTSENSLRDSRFITIRKILENKEQPSTRANQKMGSTFNFFNKKITQQKSQFAQLKERRSLDNFRRRCMSTTASHLLNSDAFTSRLDFKKMQIRKQLVLKNRGIRNYIP